MAQDAVTQRGGSAARPRPHGGPEDRAGSMRAARSERGWRWSVGNRRRGVRGGARAVAAVSVATVRLGAEPGQDATFDEFGGGTDETI